MGDGIVGGAVVGGVGVDVGVDSGAMQLVEATSRQINIKSTFNLFIY